MEKSKKSSGFRTKCHQPGPWPHDFPSSMNFLGTMARAKSILDVLTRNWQNLSQIHRTEPKLWTKTRHHSWCFLFAQNFATTPLDKKIACTILGTIKESPLQAMWKRASKSKRGCLDQCKQRSGLPIWINLGCKHEKSKIFSLARISLPRGAALCMPRGL